MAIQPPSWAKNAVPTPNGWQEPRTGELLKSQRLTQEDIDVYNGVEVNAPAPTPAHVPEPVVEEVIVQQLNEAPQNNVALDDMSKTQLEAVGRQHGVELDRRKSKTALLAELKTITE